MTGLRSMSPRKRFLSLLLAILAPACAVPAHAGLIVSRCLSNEQAFVGFALHFPIVADGRHDLAQVFNACRAHWELNGAILEFEKDGNLGDNLAFTPQRHYHKVRVPGHVDPITGKREDAPNPFFVALPAINLTMPMAPPFFRLQKQGLSTRHLPIHRDFIEGVVQGFSRNLDILWYTKALAMYHTEDPLIVHWGEFKDPEAGEQSGYAGIVVGEDGGDQVDLVVIGFGVEAVTGAELLLPGEEVVPLKAGSMQDHGENVFSFAEAGLSTAELSVADLMASDARFIVRSGAGDRTLLLRPAGQMFANPEPREQPVQAAQPASNLAWIALGLAALALVISLLRRNRS